MALWSWDWRQKLISLRERWLISNFFEIVIRRCEISCLSLVMTKSLKSLECRAVRIELIMTYYWRIWTRSDITMKNRRLIVLIALSTLLKLSNWRAISFMPNVFFFEVLQRRSIVGKRVIVLIFQNFMRRWNNLFSFINYCWGQGRLLI